mmetsp:Transcript_27008/g.58859  ORF Transcript_27008/g.58859 Transcript_27008/m.58859 type:complete len:216 (-) Transcript_27008:1170-1817(-)
MMSNTTLNDLFLDPTHCIVPRGGGGRAGHTCRQARCVRSITAWMRSNKACMGVARRLSMRTHSTPKHPSKMQARCHANQALGRHPLPERFATDSAEACTTRIRHSRDDLAPVLRRCKRFPELLPHDVRNIFCVAIWPQESPGGKPDRMVGRLCTLEHHLRELHHFFFYSLHELRVPCPQPRLVQVLNLQCSDLLTTGLYFGKGIVRASNEKGSWL